MGKKSIADLLDFDLAEQKSEEGIVFSGFMAERPKEDSSLAQQDFPVKRLAMYVLY